MIGIDRGDFLRLGAGGLLGMTTAGLTSAVAGAQLPQPVPEDDDVAYVQFGAVAERASRDLYSAALDRSSLFPAPDRRHLKAVHRAKREHIKLLDLALGSDAPTTGDFVTLLPASALTSRTRLLTLGRRFEDLLVRAYLSGAAFSENDATRLLLARLIAFDTQALAWMRVATGVPAPIGLPVPVTLDQAADMLDRYVATPDFPD